MLERLRKLYINGPAEKPQPSVMAPRELAAMLRRSADGAEMGYPPELPLRLREAAQWLDIISARQSDREVVWSGRENV